MTAQVEIVSYPPKQINNNTINKHAYFCTLGSIIYGGGQVVLPLLFDDVCQRTQLPDGSFIDSPDTWVTTAQFLAGLGMVQVSFF